MTSHIEKFVLSNPKFLTYFLPRKLKDNMFFPVISLSFSKKNLEFEILGLNIIDMEQSVSFLSTFENKFCLYENTPFFENQEFSLCINKLDSLTKSVLPKNKDRKLNNGVSIISIIPEKEKKKLTCGTFFIKSRLLSLTKGGFVSSCFNSPAYINRSSFFLKFSKQKSYKGWFSLNLGYYGFLSYFTLICFKKHIVPTSFRQGVFLNRVNFYYLQNEEVRCLFLLAKPKDFL